ncbi:MAG: AAA family ATPase, partial [Leadbetterella sp.]|nr:AAA family ATPase [Leadbetterella sp.]
MRISRISLTNFKRFSRLNIRDIPNDARLVLLIGSNGSGKSSLFDLFDWLNKGYQKGVPYGSYTEGNAYYRKESGKPARAEIHLANGSQIIKEDWVIDTGGDLVSHFIGRSSIRIVPRIGNNAAPDFVAGDLDSPETFIENDTRFVNDVHLYIQSINKALRAPVFSGQSADTLRIFREFIEPFNTSLANIFGDDPRTAIRIAEFEDATPQSPAKLIFQKGESKINYDLLSHGEKQVVILILNFIVRKDYYQDAVLFIDEMDVHLNTKLQHNTIKEITERWIPENSQLWTASHALGFIDYAQSFDKGVVLDFDELDFDAPQTLVPVPKNRYEIFELAVSREFLAKVFDGSRIIFSEESDTAFYNDLGIKNVLFFDGKDKLGAFHHAKNTSREALVDRDYLTDEEISALKKTYPFLKILPFYSIENLLYHPDNLAEYYADIHKPFDKKAYTQAIEKEKNEQMMYMAAGIAKARDGYPFFKENEHADKLNVFRKNTNAVIDMLKSSAFDTFFKVFPAKDYGKTLPERQNIR